MNNEELKSNLLSSKHWLRLVFMVLFAVLLQVVAIIMWVLVILQFFFSLITGKDNKNLREFGYSLSTYIYQILKFLTYNSEEKPFPFSDWPDADDDGDDDDGDDDDEEQAVVVEETVIILASDETETKPKRDV